VPWSPPRTTPGLDGRPLPYIAFFDQTDDLEFSPTFASGGNEIRVRYAAQAGAYSGGSPARYWQLGYVLSPAREWPSFGALDIVVQLPPGWAAASEPALERTGDELRGSFDGVPADSLAITTQIPVPATPGVIFLATVAIAIAIGWLIARRGGRFLASRGRRARWLLPVSLIYSVIAAFAIVIAGNATFSGDSLPVGQDAWTYGYAPTLLLVLSFPLIIVIFTIAMQILAGTVAGRAAPQTPPPAISGST
jgi:hypothetical protein